MHRLALPFLLLFPFLAAAADTATVVDATKARRDDATKIDWYDAREIGLEGQAFADVKAPYDRLPARAEGKVRDAVWSLSRNSAGLCVRFRTASPAVHCRWTNTSGRLAMPHMPATGVSGVDLYVRDEKGTWRWLSVGQPKEGTTHTAALVTGLPPAARDYCLYLPLYNGVSLVEIGVAADAKVAKLMRDEARQLPIVFYGTSITQGGCASRPGMVHTAIIGRRLERPIINLGFSGNGKMEAEVTSCLVDIKAAAFVIDCLPNMTAAEPQSSSDNSNHPRRRSHLQRCLSEE